MPESRPDALLPDADAESAESAESAASAASAESAADAPALPKTPTAAAAAAFVAASAAGPAAAVSAATGAAANGATATTVAVDLALQGGGSHGAFTWGVLDRLLEDDGIDIDGVSGTSAGALNAGVLATGYARGGRAGARAALDHFWADVSGTGGCFGGSPLPTALAALFNPLGLAGYNLDSNPAYIWASQFLHSFSPAQFNPYDLNLLRDVARRHVDDAAMQTGPLALFVTATAVRSGQPRVFSGSSLSLDALLASACLPTLFRPVVIDGEPYWDGGYSGNPALWPLIYETKALDILLVKINPLLRPQTPQTADEIADRVNEITYNAGLVGEMRAIAFVQRLVEQGRIDPGAYKKLRLHMVADDDGLAPLHPSSKLNTDPRFLQALRDLGRASAERWLLQHRGDIGVRSSMDIHGTFLAPDRTGG